MTFLKKYISLISVVCLLMISNQGYAFKKVGVTSFQFLKVMPGARSTAMGNAYSSIAYGADAMFWNPGALVNTDRFSLSASHVNWFMDTGHNGIAASYSLNSGISIGVVGMNIDYGSIEVTTVDAMGPTADGYNPGLTGEVINPGANALGLGFGQRLTDKFSYGVTAKYVTENMEVKSRSVLMFDAGVLFDTKVKSIVLGATIRHFGPEVEYYDKSFPLPQTMNIGISSYLIAPEEGLLLNSEKHSLLMAFDIVQPRDYDQQYNLGMEYAFLDNIYLRSGYKINYDSAGLCFGFGVKYKLIKFDYSYNDYGDYLDNVNRFSLGFEF